MLIKLEIHYLRLNLKLLKNLTILSKQQKGNSRSGELTFVESERLNFWTCLIEVIKERDKTINICKSYNKSLV